MKNEFNTFIKYAAVIVNYDPKSIKVAVKKKPKQTY